MGWGQLEQNELGEDLRFYIEDYRCYNRTEQCDQICCKFGIEGNFCLMAIFVCEKVGEQNQDQKNEKVMEEDWKNYLEKRNLVVVLETEQRTYHCAAKVCANVVIEWKDSQYSPE